MISLSLDFIKPSPRLIVSQVVFYISKEKAEKLFKKIISKLEFPKEYEWLLECPRNVFVYKDEVEIVLGSDQVRYKFEFKGRKLQRIVKFSILPDPRDPRDIVHRTIQLYPEKKVIDVFRTSA